MLSGIFKTDHSALINAVKPAIEYYLKYFENGRILKESKGEDGAVKKAERIRSIEFEEKTQMFIVRSKTPYFGSKKKLGEDAWIVREISVIDCLELMLNDEIKLIRDNVAKLMGKNEDLEKWVDRIYKKQLDGEEPPEKSEIRDSLIAQFKKIKIDIEEVQREGKEEEKREEQNHAGHAKKIFEKHIQLSKISRTFRSKISSMRGEKQQTVVENTDKEADAFEASVDHDDQSKLLQGVRSDSAQEEITGAAEEKADLAEKTIIDLPNYAIDIANFSNMSAPEFDELAPGDSAIDRKSYDFPIATFLFQSLIYIYLAYEARKQHDEELRRRWVIANLTVAGIAIGSSIVSLFFRYGVGALGSDMALMLVPPILAGVTLIPILAALVMHTYMYGKLKEKEAKIIQDIGQIKIELALASENVLSDTNNEIDKDLGQREIDRLNLVLAHYNHHLTEMKQMKSGFKQSIGISAFNIAAAVMLIVSTSVGNIFGLMVAALIIGGIVTVLPLVKKFIKGFLNTPTSIAIPVDSEKLGTGSDMNSEHKKLYSAMLPTPKPHRKGFSFKAPTFEQVRRVLTPSPPPQPVPIELNSFVRTLNPTNKSTIPPNYGTMSGPTPQENYEQVMVFSV